MQCNSNFVWVLPGLGRVEHPSLGRAWRETGAWIGRVEGLGHGAGRGLGGFQVFFEALCLSDPMGWFWPLSY